MNRPLAGACPSILWLPYPADVPPSQETFTRLTTQISTIIVHSIYCAWKWMAKNEETWIECMYCLLAKYVKPGLEWMARKLEVCYTN